MKYLLCLVLFLVAIAVAGPPLYFTHTLPLTPAILAGGCIGFACYLFDPTQFLALSADLRKSATTWFRRGDAP